MRIAQRFWPSSCALVEAFALYAAFIIGSRHGMRVLDALWGNWPYEWLARDLGLLIALGALLLLVDRFGVMACSEEADRPGARSALGWAAATLAMLGLLAVTVRILDPGSDDLEFGRRGLGDVLVLRHFLATLPIAVVIEEMVFRACQRRLRFATGSLPAVLIITFAFAWIHVRIGSGMTYREIVATTAFLAGGLLLATLYELSRSIPLLIGVHLVYDFLAVGHAWSHVQRRLLAEVTLLSLWIALSALTFVLLRFGGLAGNQADKSDLRSQ
jgi:membrane protease YdiL (CAAX protease family)